MSYYLLVIILSFLPLITIFTTSSLPHTHDGPVHLARMAAYFKALTEGGLPVRWAGDLNYGYGMPLFNFIYQLPYFLSSLFLSLGFGLVSSFKIVLSLSFVLSGIFMYLFTKEFFKDSKKAFLVTLFYQFAPFRLIELLVRGSFGEVYAYTFFPLVLFSITAFNNTRKYRYFLLLAIATALLVLSHNALSLIFFLTAVLFIVMFVKQYQVILISLASQVAGLLLSAFYWLPAIFEHSYTYGDLFMKDMYKTHFPPIFNFFIPNVFNNSSLQTGGISVQFGLFHILGIFLALIFCLRRKISPQFKKLFIFSFILLAFSLFIMEPVSGFLWERVSMLRQFQFPWRFLALTSFATSLSAVSFLSFDFFKKRWVYSFLLVFLLLSTVFYWKPPLGFDKIDEKYYWNYPLNTTYFGETDLIWSEGAAKAYPKQRIEIISGKGTIKDFVKSNQYHSYNIDAKTNIQLVDHTQYYPGWKVLIDSSSVPIQFQDAHWRGQLVFYAPIGKHTIKAFFTENKLRLIADGLSILGIVFLIITGLKFKSIKHNE